MKEYIGVDIGGTKIAVVKGNERGEILEKKVFANNVPMKEAVAKIVELAKAFGKVEAIGISCGGPLNSQTGRILSPPNLLGWELPLDG